MKTLKTSEDYAKMAYEKCFSTQEFKNAVNRGIYVKIVTEALTEHDNELITAIEKMIINRNDDEHYNSIWLSEEFKPEYSEGYKEALT
jgi:hypothetical protein